MSPTLEKDAQETNAEEEAVETFRPAFSPSQHPDFSYAYISHGLPFTTSCARHVSQTFHSIRVYIIASISLSLQTSHVRDLETVLGEKLVGTWIGIRPHTPWDDLVPIINDMREKKADLLITLGGGSLTDGAKVIIYALANDVRTIEDLESMVAASKVESSREKGRDEDGEGEHMKHFRDRSTMGKDPTVPIICIPTTLSAGEYSKFGGGTNPRTHLKAIMTHPKMFPSLVILDPALCVSTPEWVWLSTGVRAIDHCVEAICSLYAKEDVDEAAERALGLLVPGLLRTKRNPTGDLQARLDCQLAANYAMVMLKYMPGTFLAGASHGIGHQLGPLGVGHGQTSCILLPAVLKFNKKVNGEKQDKIKRILWGSPEVREVLTGVQGGLNEEKSDAGDALDVIFRALGMPRTLKEVGVTRDQFEVLAENSLKDPCCVVNPIPLEGKEQVLEILEMVVG